MTSRQDPAAAADSSAPSPEAAIPAAITAELAAPAVASHGSNADPDVIVVDSVDVTLGGQQILRDVSLRVAAGEVVALLGTNGSGKSTLVRAILGVVPHAAGSVHLFGVEQHRSVPWQRIGYVPQRMPAPTGVPATAVEVVAAGLLVGRRLRPPRGARRQALAALEVVGMAAHADRPVSLLSGGQQQRVLIARALVRTPDLLVLDEPTAGVDLDSQRVFTQAVERHTAAGGAVLVVLHELGEFAPLITRAVVLRHGEVVHDGHPPQALGEHGAPGHDHDHPHSDPLPPTSGIVVEVAP